MKIYISKQIKFLLYILWVWKVVLITLFLLSDIFAPHIRFIHDTKPMKRKNHFSLSFLLKQTMVTYELMSIYYNTRRHFISMSETLIFI